MADVDAPSETKLEPLALRAMPGGAKPAPDWAGQEPAYDHVYVVEIIDANPKNFRARVLDIPRTGITVQGDLRWSHVSGASSNGTVVQHGVLRALDLRLNTVTGALVVFHLLDLDTVFEDPDNIGSDRTIVLTDNSGMVFQPRWVENTNKAVSIILKGNPNNPAWMVARYGLKAKITIASHDGNSSNDTVSYVEIDPKIENQGEGGRIDV